MNPGGGGCREPRSRHCTPAWATERDSSQKRKQTKHSVGFRGKSGRAEQTGRAGSWRYQWAWHLGCRGARSSGAADCSVRHSERRGRSLQASSPERYVRCLLLSHGEQSNDFEQGRAGSNWYFILFFSLLRQSLALSPGWCAVARSRLNATFTSWVQVILLPQPPEYVDYRHLLPCLANFFVFLVETGFHYVGQASLELLTSDDPPASASQSAEITGMSHCDWPFCAI